MTSLKILFINTFEPVVPLYRDVFPRFEKAGMQPTAVVSACQYRNDGNVMEKQSQKQLWVPRILRSNRRWCAVFYYLIGPLILITASANTRIVFLSQPPLFYIIGSAIARWKGNRYYLHVMDLYPDLLEKSGMFGSGYLSRFMQRMSMTAFSGAEKIITIGRCMEAVLHDKGIATEKTAVVENWPDNKLASHLGEGKIFREKYGLTGKLVVMYSGNIGQFHSFDAILSVANRLQSRKDIVFVFIGNGRRRPEIEKVIHENATNILLLEPQPADQFPEIMAAGDVHFVSLRKEFEGLIVPSKFYGILAMGRPVIYEGSSYGEVARVIAEERCGVIVPSGDDQVLEEKVLGYAEERSRIFEEGRRAKTAYKERFRNDVLSQRYVEIITS